MKKSNTKQYDLTNRTGVLVAPDLAAELVDGVDNFSPESQLDQTKAAEVRATYIREGFPVGTEPETDEPEMAALLDKLGARLAFERSGVRLYDALIQKRTVLGGKENPTVADLEHIRDEELEHMHMLEECIADLGGDPTAVTPMADVSGTMSTGVLKVVADPRTTISQCLEAILTAELVDNDCWAVLGKMMQQQGMDDDVEQFEEALSEEQEHLQKVRGWIMEDSGISR